MIRIAIVEDELAAANTIQKMFEGYCAVKKVDGQHTHFSNALDFLSDYRADYDIVFMDIEMPEMDGMTAAKKLREFDENVLIVFVTNMQQFAIKGYAVNAVDFILKPVTSAAFDSMMDRVCSILKHKENKEIVVKTVGGMRRLLVSKIKYIEVRSHKLTYHTEDGVFEGWGNLNDIEKQLLPAGNFSRCNVGYLINLRYATLLENEYLIIDNDRLKISRPRKKEFLSDLAVYLGGGRNV